jgi:nitrogen regulatory protein PII
MNVKMLFVIIDRSKAEEVLKIGANSGAIYKTVLLCRGTASNEILEYLNLAEHEKALVNFIADDSITDDILRKLVLDMSLSKAGNGLAFTVPLASIGGRRVSEMLTGNNPKTERRIKAVQTEYDVIVTVVNRGFSEQVMYAAREAGARGGTVIPARGTKKNDEADFLGVAIQPEKDMVLILAERSMRHDLIRAIADGAGLKTEGAGVSFAMPVSDVAGLAKFMM